MTGVTKVNIKESVEELHDLLRKQKTAVLPGTYSSFVFTENRASKNSTGCSCGVRKRKGDGTQMVKGLYPVRNNGSIVNKKEYRASANY